jgi:1-acyl-sn-glycerol-3-phosphate acyltransferase
VVQCSPRLDGRRVHLFVANHVNVFDPFTICAAVPQPACGFELESHFRIPVYGWLMRGFGNVAVPDRPGKDAIARMRRDVRDRVARGSSLILFPEGTRTRTGHVGPFRAGAFRIVAELGIPVVPVSQVGAFELQHPGRGRLEPSTVVVRLHDPIETEGLPPARLEALLEQIRDIVRAPVERPAR